MEDAWRLAFMFNARGGDLDALEEALVRVAGGIRGVAGEAHVRLGVADVHPDLGASFRDREKGGRRIVDGAVEITVAAGRAGELTAIAGALRDTLDELAGPGSTEVMTGPVFSIVPVRDGGAFLSLAFKRYPRTTSQQFRDWWLHQHAKVATPVLGAGLLAYDQVHVDAAATQAVAQAFGVAPVAYDAYDNLTWDDRDAFLRSISDPVEMARVYADEEGHIDHASARSALMRRVG